MNIPVLDKSKPYKFKVYSYKMEDLKEQARLSVCSCYYYTFVNMIDDWTQAELEEFIQDPYHFHHEEGETWKDCPQWEQDRQEYFDDIAIMERRGK